MNWPSIQRSRRWQPPAAAGRRRASRLASVTYFQKGRRIAPALFFFALEPCMKRDGLSTRVVVRARATLLHAGSRRYGSTLKVNMCRISPIAGLLVGKYGAAARLLGFGRLSRLRAESGLSRQLSSMNFAIEA